MKSKNLKLVLAVAIFFSFIFTNNVFGQQDTTKIKVGDKKIIIIEDNYDDGDEDFVSTNMDSQIKECQKNIAELEAKNEDLETELENTIDEAKKVELENQIEANEELIEANEEKIEEYQEGIDEIRIELSDLEEELDNLGEEIETEIEAEFNDENCSSKCDKKKKFKGNWAGFEFGLNNYVVKDLDFDLPTENQFMDLKPNLSWGFALNLPEFNIPFGRYTGLVTGLGFEWNNYRFKSNIDLIEENGVITYQSIDPEVMKYTKNSLNAIYLNLPLIWEIQVPINHKDKRAFVGVGVVGGVLLTSKTKKTYVNNGEERKIDNKDDYNLNPFKYGLTARLGVGDVQLFANYSMSTLFEENAGPELYPVSAGLRINF